MGSACRRRGASDAARQAGFRKAGGAGGERGRERPWLRGRGQWRGGAGRRTAHDPRWTLRSRNQVSVGLPDARARARREP